MTTGESAYLILAVFAFLAFSAGLAYSSWTCPGRPARDKGSRRRDDQRPEHAVEAEPGGDKAA